MKATLEKIARDRRCIALMNMMKRGHNAIFRRSEGRLNWLPTDGDVGKTDEPAKSENDNIFTM